MSAEGQDVTLRELAASLASACVGLHACDLGPPVTDRVGEYHNEPPASREECARCCSESRIFDALRHTRNLAYQKGYYAGSNRENAQIKGVLEDREGMRLRLVAAEQALAAAQAEAGRSPSDR